MVLNFSAGAHHGLRAGVPPAHHGKKDVRALNRGEGSCHLEGLLSAETAQRIPERSVGWGKGRWLPRRGGREPDSRVHCGGQHGHRNAAVDM